MAFSSFCFVLLAHARQFANLTFAGEFFNAVYVADFVGAPDQRDCLWSETLNLEQLKHRRMIFLQQFGLRAESAVFE